MVAIMDSSPLSVIKNFEAELEYFSSTISFGISFSNIKGSNAKIRTKKARPIHLRVFILNNFAWQLFREHSIREMFAQLAVL